MDPGVRPVVVTTPLSGAVSSGHVTSGERQAHWYVHVATYQRVDRTLYVEMALTRP